jgi:sulfate adenylyltransferase
VLFFTGLSGSGKSTLARALMDRLLEQGSRTVTSLDGDVVRRNLSAGLTFSKEDRETNIRRIGWVAAEISRHGGVAVCSPIAPFDETRQQVRAMVDEAGGAFFLVHVATPLEECERRDRKGLYAKARRGEIPEFTGISSPYEEPEDADVRVDTTDRSIEDALDDVLVALRDAGYLDLTDPEVSTSSTTEVETGEEITPEADSDRLHILFVCTANICRSPFMELTARDLAGPGATVTFASAGTHGFREHPMDVVMGKALGSRGLGNDDFLSQPLTAELIEDADLVLTAEATHRTFILDDHPSSFRKVFTLGQFAEAVRTLSPDLSGRELLQAAGVNRGGAVSKLDVRDPYGRGPEAAEACAVQIDELLRVVVPALTGTRKVTA